MGLGLLWGYRQSATLGRASASWPSAWGTVITSHVIPASGDDLARHAFEAVTPAEGGLRCFTINYGSQRRSPQSLAAAYPVGASVLIHYDPDERIDHRLREHRAVIEPGLLEFSRFERVFIPLLALGVIAGGVASMVVEAS